MGQQGWSAGAYGNALLVDPSNPPNVTTEAITGAAANGGLQSWHYQHGITGGYQFGPGTPFSPGLGVALDQVGFMFYGTLFFKAASPGDNSYIRIDTGNPAGNDRAEIIGYLNNYAGDLSVSIPTVNGARDGFTEVTAASNLDANSWHRMDFIVTRTAQYTNTVAIAIDQMGWTVVEGALGFYRSDEVMGENAYYEASNRLKFAGTTFGDGFYFDDISYAVAPIPEPSTYAAALGVLALGAVFAARRRRGVA